MIQVITEIEFNAFIARLDKLEKRVEEAEKAPMLLEWVTREQAAIILNRSPNTVSAMAKDGRLRYRKEARKLEIDLQSIKEYQKSFQIN